MFDSKKIIIAIFCILSGLTITCGILAYYFYNKEELCPTTDDFSVYNNDGAVVNEEVVKSFVYVEVKGAVVNPGVYEVEENSIIDSVIKLAGGFLENAYIKNINLAKKVEDEMVLYVFTKNEFKKSNTDTINTESCNSNGYLIDNCTNNFSSVIISGEVSSSGSSNTEKTNIININIATLKELMTLPGVGESKAQAIIDYRENTGLFKTIEEIKNVSGIGEATFEKFKKLITV